MQVFDAEQTRDGLPFGPLIEALRRQFAAGCEVPLRHSHVIAGTDGQPAGTVLLMPAWRPGGRLGIKTVNIFPGNAGLGKPGLHSVYTLFDANTGEPLAQMDGNQITSRRTVAASALAASYLARPEAARLLVVGAGRVARLVPEAMSAVRPSLADIEVWNHRAEGAEALAAEWRAAGLSARAVPDLEAAVRRADIVSCATLSTQALVRGAWLQAGAHLDLVGSFTPQMREADSECFRRAAVCVDTAEALAKAGDVLQAVAEGAFDSTRLRGTLAELCRGQVAGRVAAGEITLFKSVGTALEDLAAAERVFDARVTGR